MDVRAEISTDAFDWIPTHLRMPLYGGGEVGVWTKAKLEDGVLFLEGEVRDPAVCGALTHRNYAVYPDIQTDLRHGADGERIAVRKLVGVMIRVRSDLLQRVAACGVHIRDPDFKCELGKLCSKDLMFIAPEALETKGGIIVAELFQSYADQDAPWLEECRAILTRRAPAMGVSDEEAKRIILGWSRV